MPGKRNALFASLLDERKMSVPRDGVVGTIVAVSKAAFCAGSSEAAHATRRIAARAVGIYVLETPWNGVVFHEREKKTAHVERRTTERNVPGVMPVILRNERVKWL